MKSSALWANKATIQVEEKDMRAKIVVATAVICVAGLALTGCNRQQNTAEQGGASAPAAAGAPAAPAPTTQADMSPEGNKKFLDDNAKKDGVKTTASGLQYRVIKTGAGKSPTVNDIVNVTYKGWLIDGTVFDQTQQIGRAHV